MINVVLGKYFRSFFILSSSLILVKYLSIDHFAEFVFFNTFLLFLITLLIGPSPTLFTKYFSNPDLDYKHVINKGIQYWSLISLLGVAIFYVFLRYFDNPLTLWNSRLLFFGVLIFIVNITSILLDTIYRANKSYKISEGAKVFESIIWLSGIFILSYLNLLNIENIIILFLLRISSMLFIYLYSLKNQNLNSAQIPKKIQFFNDFSSLYFYRFFGFVLMRSNSLMLGFLSTNIQLAYYGFAFIFYQILVILPGAVSWYLLSRTNEKSFFESKDYIKVSSITYLVCFIQAVIIFMIAPFLAFYLKGDEYFESIKVIKILAIASLFQAPQFFLSSFWIYKNRYKTISILLTVIGLSNIFMNIIIIPTYGALGAAATLLFSYSIGTIIQIILLHSIKDKSFSIISLFYPKYSYLKEIYHMFYEELKSKK
tara:strand:- start:9402 stop:10682 length:1281 start_codon:yes stop_codon:yes gene_type:complete